MKICDVSGPSIGDESSTDKGTESPKMVEVIGPNKEGGRLKMVLNLPGTLLDVKENICYFTKNL